MSRPDAAARPGKDRSLPFFSLAIALTLLAVSGLGWNALRGYRFVTRQSQTIRHLEELRGRILRFDEVLTLSAHLAAATGKPRWEARYRQVAPQLDATLEELIHLSTEKGLVSALARTNAANIRLVAMENRVFALVRAGKKNEAQQLLLGDAYENQKRLYAAGMAEFNDSLRLAIQQLEAQARTRMIWVVIASALSVPLLIFGWALAFRASRQQQTILEERNRQLNMQAEKLLEFSHQLESQVAARTALLHQQYEKFRIILDNIEAGYFEIDLAGNFTYCNPAMARLLDYPADQLTGMNYRVYTDPENQQFLFEAVNGVFRTGTSLQAFDWTVVRRDGARRHMESSFSLIRDQRRQAVGFRGIVRDITERRCAEIALQTSELRYRSLINASAQLIFAADANGRVVSPLPSWQAFTGLSEAKVQGHGWSSAVHPEDTPALMTHWRHCIETHTVCEMEFRARRSDGDYRLLAMRSVPVFSGNGEVIEWVGAGNDITAARAAEATNAELAAIVAGTDDAVCSLTLDGRVTSWNAGAERLYGYSAAEIIGNSIDRIYPAGGAAELGEKLRELVQGRQITQHDVVRRHKDGRRLDLSVTFSPLYTRAGAVYGVSGIARDIGPRRRAELDLALSETRYRSLVNATTQIVWFTDGAGLVAGPLPAWQAFTGMSEAEALGFGWVRAVHPDDVPALMEKWQGCIVTQTPYESEFRGRRADGVYRLLTVRGIPVLDAEGRTVEWGGACQDVTEEREVKAVNAELAAIVSGSEDAIYSYGLDGRVKSWNAGAELLYGFPAGEIIGESVALIFPEDGAEELELKLRSIALGKRIELHDTRRRRRDGCLIDVAITLSPLHGPGGTVNGASVIARDIGLRREAEATLQRAKEAAESSNRAKSEFLANMSHEIRTPMNGVVGMAELLLGTELSVEQRDYAQMVKGSAESLMVVINDILDFSKIEAGKLDLAEIAFNIRAVLGKVAKELGIRAEEKGLTLICDIPSNVPEFITGDPGRIRQIVYNLIGNSIKFTQHGAVHLSAQWDDAAPLPLRLTVRDTGIGIPKEKQQLIFEAFTQADGSTTRNFGGTGLGLTITRNLVGLMAGCIRLESEPGRGSTFIVELPLQRGQAPVAANTDHESAAGSRDAAQKPRSLSILVAEDNLVNQRVAQRLLEQAGHQVTIAANGRAAIDAIARQAFDLVLMDVQMPVMDGLAAAREIRSSEAGTSRHLPVIALTAHALKEDELRCLTAGMDGYASKPLQLGMLEAVIARVLSENGALATAAQPPQNFSAGRSVELLAGVGGDTALLVEIAELFEADAAKLLIRLEDAVRGGDAEAVRFVAHSLKGSISNFRDPGAVAAAERLEVLGRSGRLDGADAARHLLEREVNRLRAELATARLDCVT